MRRWVGRTVSSLDPRPSSAQGEEGSVRPQGPVVSTQLVVVLRPGASPQELLAASQRGGLVATEVSFPDSSPLCDHPVVAVGVTPSVLRRLAEQHGLHKRLDHGVACASEGPLAEASASARACDVALWQPFTRARAEYFAGASQPDTFFSPSEVLHMILDTLCSSRAPDSAHPVLLKLNAAGELDSVLALPEEEDLTRLNAVWSPMALWKPVPEAEIADYFGVTGAQYFILMHAYAHWLMLPALLGIASFFWNEEATTGPHSRAFTHSRLCPVFVLAVIVWSTVCLSNWRRSLAVSKYNLGHQTFHTDHTPTFDAAWHYFRCRGLRVKPDGSMVPQAPPTPQDHRAFRYILMVFAMLVLLGVSGVVVGALFEVGDWARKNFAGTDAGSVALQNSPILLYMVTVGIFSRIYEWLAEWLTDLESHTRFSGHARSLTIKKAFFNIINYLGYFLYLACWKQDYDFLRSQLLSFFTVKQVVGNVLELGVPGVQSAWAHWTSGRNHHNEPTSPGAEEVRLRHAIECEWRKPTEDICDDYLEVAVLFAAATWFAPIFPLGIVLAFMHAITEAWADSWKICNVTRRMVRRGAGLVVIEAWLDVFLVIGLLGIGISLALFRVGGADLVWDRFHLEVAEKVVLFIWLYLQLSIPHEPEWLVEHVQKVDRLIPRQLWLSSAAMEHHQETNAS